MKRPPPSPDAAQPAAPRVIGTLVLLAGVGLALVSLADGAWADGAAPVPFVWGDVALVHLLCAVPLAGLLAAVVYARLPPVGAAAVAAGALGAGVLPLTDGLRADVLNVVRSEPLIGAVLRAGAALGVALAAALVAAVLIGVRRPSVSSFAWKPALAYGLLGSAALVVPPATHTAARCRHDAAALGELLEQSRFGEARSLSRGMLVLDAKRTFRGRPLSEVAQEVEKVIADLERVVALPLPVYAPTRERVNYARALATLGRTEDALAALQTATDPNWAAEVQNLRGAIHETREEWDLGLNAHRAAREAWERSPASRPRAAGLLKATTGIAYCLRRAGRNAEAEVVYLEVLAQSPTADTHFLLARFYDDAQQARKAQTHARRAIELAPDRYGQEGAKLIKKLTRSQFGCLGVYHDSEGPVTVPVGGTDQIR